MKAFGTFVGIVIGLVLLAFFLIGGYFLFKYVGELFDMLDSEIKAIAAIASIVALVCAMIIAGGLRGRSRKDEGSHTAMEKVRLYKQLLIFWSDQLKTPAGEKELVAASELIHLEQLLALHGSSKVITVYVKLRRLARQERNLGEEAPVLLNKLVLEMRVDLGCPVLNLKEKDLLDLLLSRN